MTITRMSNTPIAFVDLDAIQHNLDLARSRAPQARLLAMVKGNAYGHGVDGLVQRLQGIDAFGVARVSEGQQLRALGVELPIVVLQGFLDTQELMACRQAGLTPTVHAQYQLDLLVDENCTELPIWLKLDSGMHRLGFTPTDFTAVLHSRRFNPVCLISHLANADSAEHALNLRQLAVFKQVTGDTDLPCSLANSGAILSSLDNHFDWIRPGIMLYGSSPTGKTLPVLRPVMTLTAPILAVSPVAAGEAVGYGSIWRAAVDTRIAVVGIGYADGYPREVPDAMPVLIGGQRCPIVGRISMDTLMVDIGALPVKPGARVQLWGPQLPVDEVAALINTIGYTLMSRLTSRVRREYIAPSTAPSTDSPLAHPHPHQE
jgi:alanine racemase